MTLKPETITWGPAYEKNFLPGNCKFFVTEEKRPNWPERSGFVGGGKENTGEAPAQGHYAGAELLAVELKIGETRLFFRKNGILHRFTDAEFQRGFCGDLNRLAGGRVAAFAGLSL